MVKPRNDLTQEQVRELFDYDAENGWLIRKTIRNGCPYNKPCGHKPDCHGYGQVGIDGKHYRTHRLVWLLVHGEWPEHEIDHIDQNKMNNRIENLRPATPSENQHNKGLRRDNSTGYPGVTFNKAKNKFMAQISVKGKHIYLGLFATAEEAYRAYQLAKIKFHPTSPIAQEYIKELGL